MNVDRKLGKCTEGLETKNKRKVQSSDDACLTKATKA